MRPGLKLSLKCGQRWLFWILTLLTVALSLACNGSAPVPVRETATPFPPPTATAAPPPTAAPTPFPEPTATSQPTATQRPAPTATVALTATPEPTAAPTPTVPASTPTPTAVDAPAVLEGRWEGVNIPPGGIELPFVVTLYVSDDGLQGTMDLPSQGAFGLELSEVAFQSGRLHFELDTAIGLAAWDGELRDEVIEGDLSQAGRRGTFRLIRSEMIAAAAPSQDEEAPPYRMEEVTFANGDIVLVGSLTLPDADGPHPAVVLISGSGAQDRDANLFGFKTFAIIADHLARHSVAVLRFDDRGVGGSSGNVLQATINDRAQDVKAAVELLRARDDIAPALIGLIGHSEGGMIAPLVASRHDGVAFVVLLAAPAVAGDAILRAQLVEILKADGATQEQIERAQAQQELMLRAVATGEGWDEVEASARQTARQQIEALPEAQREAIADIDLYIDTIIPEQMKYVQSPWYKSFYEYDPAPALAGLTVPALALYGELDTQVPAELNATAFVEAIAEVGNPDYTVVTLTEANHLFQEAITGSLSEYAELKPEFAPGFLDSISEWILQRVGGP